MSDSGMQEMDRWDQVAVPPTTVSVYEALYRRRQVESFRNQPVPYPALERVLATAVWAPNHRMTEPWRFVVMEQDSPLRRSMGNLAFDQTLKELGDEAKAENYRKRILSPPVVIYVFSVPGPNDFVTKENYASVCCAIQNMSLAAVAEGFGISWETGRVSRLPGLHDVLGVDTSWSVVSMLSLGYPEDTLVTRRTPTSQFVFRG
jgi:nitroreductase